VSIPLSQYQNIVTCAVYERGVIAPTTLFYSIRGDMGGVRGWDESMCIEPKEFLDMYESSKGKTGQNGWPT
jgi:hypothetical protein